MTPEETTTGTLLGGRVSYTQPARGFRSGIEPVLLAASIPAMAGQHVMEAGTGAGAGLLCLAARVPEIAGLGIECDPGMATLAAQNFAANGFADLRTTCADITEFSPDILFDHAFANPPYHTETGAVSPLPGRAIAKLAHADTIGLWIAALARAVRVNGTISLILPATRLDQALAGFGAARCGAIQICPLWPLADRDAKLLIVQARRSRRTPLRLRRGIVLHQEHGGYTDSAAALLEYGRALEW